ncbi:hypothetical protein HHL22_12005 [Hymenobacter sp. RP-2-7]|uniref:Uncharacterized protein n=1 Tax=Hymenobacter polaris TaxID=2682546 RepID=A0A7Y0AF49_9BACT|nr:hypothetical protein [Hymenobacter polaris]NML65930.1 hypothetical protein [Hymenobacter polaris]
MSLINKALVGILFSGAALPLASAAWKNQVRAIYGFNAAGTGYTVFKPANTFNSLQQLVPEGSYILDVAQPGFELPGAVLTGADAAGPTLTVSELTSGLDDTGRFYVRCRLTSSQPGDATASVLLALPTRSGSADCAGATWATGVALGHLVDLPIDALVNSTNGLNQDDAVELFAVTSSGAQAYQQFEFGNNPVDVVAA